MHTNLQKRFSRLEQQKDTYLKDLGSWSQTQRVFKPDGNQWSAMEVLEHVVKVDAGITQTLIKYQNTISEEKLGWKAWTRSVWLNTVLRAPTKIKAPNVSGIQPEEFKDLKTQADEWQQSRALLHGYLRDFPLAKTSHFIFKHPFAGKLNIEQTLMFLYYHAYHHQHQLKRIYGHKAYPPS